MPTLQCNDTEVFFGPLNPRELQLLRHWNTTEHAHAGPACLHELFLEQARRRPDAPALQHATQTWTYAQAATEAGKLAGHLRQHGIGPGDIVGILSHRHGMAIIAMLGVLQAGAAYLPLDPKYPKDRLQLMLEDSGCRLVLAEPALADALEKAAAPMVPLLNGRLPHLPRLGPAVTKRPGANDLAYIIYTSGSTGRPKGVAIEHRSVVNYAVEAGRLYGVGPHDRFLQFSSFSFDASVEEIFVPLCNGAALVLRTDDMVQTAGRFFEACTRLAITAVGLPTAYVHELATHLETQSAPWPRQLRLLIMGGEQALPDRMKRLRQAAGPEVRLVNTYGPTEATIACTFYELPAQINEQDIIPIGTPLANTTAWVLDPDMHCAPIEHPGELCIGGVGVARGYLNRPELTAEKFIPDPLHPGRRLYRTGDLVAWQADGTLRFFGRVDNQVKIRGFRIELGEIETVLNSHPEISQNAVVARDGQRGEKQLVAYYVAAAELPVAQLRSYLSQRMPEYMVPARFVHLERLPVTPNGKIDRKALPEPPVLPLEPSQTVRNALELQIQLAFERVLAIPNISTEASFFELGGDSLKALQLVVELERIIGAALPIGLLYQTSSISALAEALQDYTPRSVTSSLVPMQPNGSAAPLFFIHTTPGDILGYGNLVYHLERNQPCYGLQSLGLVTDQAHTTIEEMARHYIQELRQIQPKGPYRLCGWCYGGIVAYEMATMLKAEGEEISVLALIDTPASAPNWRTVPMYYLHRLGRLFSMKPRHLLAYFRAKARYYQALEIENNKRFKRIEPAQEGDQKLVAQQNALLERLERLYTLNMQALDKYQPQPYSGTVHLLNASEQDPAKLPDPCYGWKGLARDIRIKEIPGDHDGILKEPNVAVLAQYLRELLTSRPVRVFLIAFAGWKLLFAKTSGKLQHSLFENDLALSEMARCLQTLVHG